MVLGAWLITWASRRAAYDGFICSRTRFWAPVPEQQPWVPTLNKPKFPLSLIFQLQIFTFPILFQLRASTSLKLYSYSSFTHLSILHHSTYLTIPFLSPPYFIQFYFSTPQPFILFNFLSAPPQLLHVRHQSLFILLPSLSPLPHRFFLYLLPLLLLFFFFFFSVFLSLLDDMFSVPKSLKASATF